jgi:hypothetical protein
MPAAGAGGQRARAKSESDKCCKDNAFHKLARCILINTMIDLV